MSRFNPNCGEHRLRAILGFFFSSRRRHTRSTLTGVQTCALPISSEARAEVRMAVGTARILRELPKGDALATAQLAGIMAAKRTSELIPLCHPLPLTHVEVTLEIGRASCRERVEIQVVGGS